MVACIYAQTRGFGFVNYDDGTYVYGNAQIARGFSLEGVRWAFTHVHSQNWHPVTTISHMLDCQLFGLNAGRQHLVNVLLHVCNSLLLFLVLRQMTGALWRAAFVAAIWAVHPLRVESVAWIAERKDVLSGLFFLVTVVAYVHYARRPGWVRYLLVSLCFALGLMAKPMLVTTPLVLLLLDYWPLQRVEDLRKFGRLVAEKIPLFVLSLGSCVATLLAQRQATGSVDELPLTWRIGNALITAVTYIGQMFWPVNLTVFYPHPEGGLPSWQVIGAGALLIVISAVAFVWRRKCRYLLTGWFWYLAMLLPVIGIVQVGLQGHADRYTYLPHIGLAFLFTWGIADLTSGWRWRIPGLAAAATVVIVALGVSGWRQATYWRNSETLWTHALVAQPETDVARAGRGDVLLARGDTTGAIADFEVALRIRPDNPEVHARLGDALNRSGNRDDAIRHWSRAVELQPEQIAIRDSLGAALAQRGRITDAVAQWRESLKYDPNDGNALSNLAWVRATSPDASLRNGTEAVELAQRASLLAGGKNPLVLRTLAAAYAEEGQFREAISIATRAADAATAQFNSALADELRQNAALYARGEPLRDPSLTNR